MRGALDGILVADFSRVLAGPYATMLLGDLGATVVKVERPGAGDDTRAWGPPFASDGQSTYFQSVNRNKASIALDLSDDADRELAGDLARVADVLVENYRPGGLARFGLDHAALREANPSLIYCSISGFGSGAGADLPGYDLLVQAMGGLMSITGTSEPTKAGVALVDVLTGLHAAVGVLAALHHRDATGEGQHLEVTLLSALQSSLVNQASAFVGAGSVPRLLGNAHPSIAPYEVYATADRPMILAVGNDGQFRRLVNVLGSSELADDPRFATNPARVAHREELNAALSDRLASAGADSWQERLTAAGVPCGPINDIAQGFALAERLGLEPIVEIDDGRRSQPQRQVANPVRYSATPPSYASAPPDVDEDRDHVLALIRERGRR
ncbi:MAG: CoA transferase [Actinomycetales bacterium]|nr:CoA transferase [Actinomycetales bacterium]